MFRLIQIFEDRTIYLPRSCGSNDGLRHRTGMSSAPRPISNADHRRALPRHLLPTIHLATTAQPRPIHAG